MTDTIEGHTIEEWVKMYEAKVAEIRVIMATAQFDLRDYGPIVALKWVLTSLEDTLRRET